MKAIVLAGGRGVRLQPFTRVLPKPLIPIDDMVILQIILLQLRDAGCCDITLSVCHKAHLIERFFGNGDWLGVDLQYVFEPEQLGTAGSLALINHFDQPALVMNADLLTTIDFADVYNSHLHSGAQATVVLCQHTIHVDFGVVEIDEYQRMVNYAEKPSVDFLVSGGIYVLDPEVKRYITPGRSMDMPTLLQAVRAHNFTVNGYRFSGEWIDIGTPEQLRRAEDTFHLHRERFLKRASMVKTNGIHESLATLPRVQLVNGTGGQR